MQKRGVSSFFFENFLFRENYFMDKRGDHSFPSKFLSHYTKIFHWRTLWCFRKILLSKIFMHRTGCITVLSKFFVSQDRNEKLCKRTLLFSGNFLVSKKICGYHDFQSKFLGLTVPKTFVGIPSMFQKIWVSKNFMHTGGNHVFPSKIFGLTVPKNFVRIPSKFQKIWGVEKC